MFEKWVPPGGRGMYQTKYKGQLVVASTKGYLWVSPEVHKVLGNSKYLCVLQNNSDWALKATHENDEGAYVIDNKQNGQFVVRAASFIKASKLPVGYIFKGRLQDGMVVFSKTPTEKA